mgnify:FL=1
MLPGPRNIWLDPDEIDIAVRREAWQMIADRFDRIIDDFYETILGSHHANLLDGFDIARLKANQKNHWERLFLEKAVDNVGYLARMARMYVRHREIGLDNTNYISAYIFLLGAFHRAVLQGAQGPRRAHELISAINAIVAGDIARAMESGDGRHFID